MPASYDREEFSTKSSQNRITGGEEYHWWGGVSLVGRSITGAASDTILLVVLVLLKPTTFCHLELVTQLISSVFNRLVNTSFSLGDGCLVYT